MPLPKPPSKKGDLLKSADYEAQAAPRADKRSLKARAAEVPRQSALDLYDGSAAAVVPAPARSRATPRGNTPAPTLPAPAAAAPVACWCRTPAPRWATW